jgi:ferritin-like metal-binding protein YciE
MKRLLRGEGSESCKPLHALASNVEDTIKDVTNPQVLDLALIGAAQLMEHYDFATCSTLRAWARTIGQRDAYLVLTSIEADARRTDRLLHELQERLREGSPAMAA